MENNEFCLNTWEPNEFHQKQNNEFLDIRAQKGWCWTKQQLVQTMRPNFIRFQN